MEDYQKNGMKSPRSQLLLPKALSLHRLGYSGRKLVSGILLTAAVKETAVNFAPFQLSLLISNGSETVVHLIRRLHDFYGKTHVLFQLDVANAFNSVSRFKGLLAIARHLPQLYTNIFRTYRIKNKLWVDATDEQIQDHILSQEGSTQRAVDCRRWPSTIP